MTEVTFAKSFLAALDSRPQKISADHVEDPRCYPARMPYILPRMPRQMTRPATSTTSAAGTSTIPGQEPSATVVLRSLRNPPIDIKLPARPLASTSVLELRGEVADRARVPLAKVRVLHNKKPVPDSRVLRDLLPGPSSQLPPGGVLEFSVMIMGGAASVLPPEQPESREGGGGAASGAEAANAATAAVQGEAFWDDLRGFLLQRLNDENQADELFGLFLRAWESRDEAQ